MLRLIVVKICFQNAFNTSILGLQWPYISNSEISFNIESLTIPWFTYFTWIFICQSLEQERNFHDKNISFAFLYNKKFLRITVWILV